MNKPVLNRKRLITSILVLVLGFGAVFTAKAVFPESFWRMVQISERLSFLYGGVDNPSEYMSIESDGRVGIGVIPQNSSAILELKSEDKALLVTRVDSVHNVTNVENGMIVYERAQQCFRVYQNDAWSKCLGVSGSIRVLDQDPADGRIGDIYYNRTNNTLFIFDGNTWVAVTANFLELVPYNHSCTRHVVTNPSLQIQCPSNKHITSLFYEAATFSHTLDVHEIPEINAVECCQTTHYPFFWHTSEWSQCNGGTQSRTISCRDVSGAVVADGSCIASHRPNTSQNCEEPVVPARWEIGEYGQCSQQGVQTREVTCVGSNGQSMLGQCDPSIKPPTARGCDVPFNCSEIIIGAGHPLYPFTQDGRVNVGSDRITFTNQDAVTSFVKSVQPSGLTGVGVVGVENHITSANISQSQTAQAVCRKAGFQTVLSGTTRTPWDSPHDNTLYYWNGSAFATTNAKHPGSNVKRNTSIATLVCAIPFGISVDARCPGGGGTTNPPTNPPTDPACSAGRIYDSAVNNPVKGTSKFYDVPCDGSIRSYFFDDNARIYVDKPGANQRQILLTCDDEEPPRIIQEGTSICVTKVKQHGGALCSRDNTVIAELRNDGQAKGCPGKFRDHTVPVKAGDRLEMLNSGFASGHGWVEFIPN